MEPTLETVSTARSRHSGASKLLGLMAGVVIAFAVIALASQSWVFSGSGPAWYGRLMLAGTRTVEGPFESRAVYEYGLFGRKAVALQHPGMLVDYDRSGTHEAVLTFDKDTAEMAVVVLGAEPRTVAASTTIKSSLSISPDGRTAAYAELARIEAGKALLSAEEYYDPSRWVVKTVDLESGTITTHGIGYAPQLFTYNGVSHLLFTNGIGIRVVSLAGDPLDVFRVFSTSGRQAAEIADDGSHLAIFDTTISTYRIFRVDGIGKELTLTELFRYPGFHQVAFDGARAVIALPVFEAGTAAYYLASLDLSTAAAPAPAVRVMTGVLPNKLIP